ncbi:hypothetical protein P171DRAFT_154296 [Karstenula rhodostoma CBS 690.94]|uniref:Uncharacterized protein n=1 Tax=Karstenula rhodostoma CBS 690.94 TaxID=1392251 RepID=A0A9P4P5C9_9PLEO|nr:hypothetical protein P171DRAFT_154296 [Karstenula rhodostoma CBS 690.94]
MYNMCSRRTFHVRAYVLCLSCFVTIPAFPKFQVVSSNLTETQSLPHMLRMPLRGSAIISRIWLRHDVQHGWYFLRSRSYLVAGADADASRSRPTVRKLLFRKLSLAGRDSLQLFGRRLGNAKARAGGTVKALVAFSQWRHDRPREAVNVNEGEIG